MAERIPIFITREVLEDVSAEIVRDALLEVANEHGVEVYPRRAPNVPTLDDLIEELMDWYEQEPTGPRWVLLGQTIRALIAARETLGPERGGGRVTSHGYRRGPTAPLTRQRTTENTCDSSRPHASACSPPR